MTDLILPYHVRQDTLAYLKAQPLFAAKPMRDAWVPDIVKSVTSYLNGCGNVHPETHAVSFYAGNAVWAELLKKYASDEPLPPDALELGRDYVTAASKAAQRLMYYLMLIITRESRHVYASIYPQMIVHHGAEFQKFNQYMHGASGSMHAKDLFLANPPKMRLGDYADAIAWTFHKGHYSHQFGGKNWAVIADVFKSMVNGEFSPEMATDVSWALAHNTGAIFNKGMTYHMYDKFKLKQILDVQRAGQIPEYIADPSITKEFVHFGTGSFMDRARKVFPKAWGDYVNWQKVEEAGAVQSYAALKKNQITTPLGNVYWFAHDQYVNVKERAAA